MMLRTKSILSLCRWTGQPTKILYTSPSRRMETTATNPNVSEPQNDRHHSTGFPGEEDFRRIQIVPVKKDRSAQREVPSFKKNVPPPRSKRMSTDQHWPSVWPAARTFHPAIVPLPLHMGYIEKPERYSPPSKYANAELMKIPNFLHLSPPAVKAHCQAIKKFCTKWPKELATDEDCEKHFPIEIVFTDFVHASSTIRDPRSRLVKMMFKVDSLPLDYHGKDKIKRLFNCNAQRYNKKTDVVTLVADRCPMKRQNYDFLQYVLTASFFEASKKEEWEETEKTFDDWEKFYWTKSASYQRTVTYLKACSLDPDHQVEQDDHESRSSESQENRLIQKRMKEDPVIKSYEESLTELYDSGETEESLKKYKESVVNLLFPPSSSVNPSVSSSETSSPSSSPPPPPS